ncbi:MAG: Mur ligase family protein [Candidatus Roizmanbacteria bacterium]|nr:Mur ligase family protein [Candidatus Roizmanbacteria bacterium]
MAIYTPQGIKKQYHLAKRFFAKKWLSRWNPTQLAITGSQGKTSVTYMTQEVLSLIGSTVCTDLALDTTFNVPITALKVMPWTKYLIWELGIDHPGEMAHHLEIAKPSIGCVTGISPVHTDEEHMGSIETLITEKRKLIEALPTDGIAILNNDDVHVQKMADHTKAKIKWYGSSTDCDMSVDLDSIQVSLEGTSATFRLQNKEFVLKTGLIGVHHVYTIMASYLLAYSASKKYIVDIFQEKISHIKPLRGRMNMEKGPLNTTLLNDSLRANPQSTNTGLKTLELIKYEKGKKIAVIGEMGELEHPEAEHRKTGELLSKLNIDFVIGIGPLRKFTIDEAIKNGFPKEKTAYAEDIFQAAKLLESMLKPGDLWYLKGSLLRNYKRIVQLLNGEEVCCGEVMCPYDHCGYT